MNYSRQMINILTPAVFFTGFSALLYQVVWQRMLGLFSGSDVSSVTIITSAFLAGLGIGSLVGSFYADRVDSRRAVIIFGLCNLGIGLFAISSRFLYYDFLFLELQTIAESPIALLIAVFTSLLVPTTLMGLSLPFLAKAVVRSTENAAPLITRLYGINTLGAGIGTIVSGWYLLGTLGYEASVYLGATISLAVASIAILAATQFSADDGEKTLTRESVSLRSIPPSVWGWCVMVFISGFIAISLEIIWFRLLDVTLKSNAYTFAHLLSFFLIGDAIGSLVGARFVHLITNPRKAFLILQGLIGTYSIAVILLIVAVTNDSPLGEYIRTSGNKIELTLEDSRLLWAVYLGLPAIMMLPPSFLIGFYYPIVQKAIQTDETMVGQRVGIVEVANIMGNTLGGVFTGAIFLHYLGTANSLRLITLLGLGFVLFLLWENRKTVGYYALAGIMAVVIVIFPNQDTLWSRLHGVESEPAWVAEDSTGVSVIIEQGDTSRLYANGQFQGFIPYNDLHVFLGVLPSLVHPDPQDAFIIGVGSSGTPYSVGARAENVTVVEIIGAELDVLDAFAADRNLDYLANFFTRDDYTIIVGDGRRQLVHSGQKYDIIEADAIRPVSSHSGLLYSREYFEAAKAQLNDGGIMAQWNATFRVEATFKQVFPYVLVLNEILLGSEQPIDFDLDTLLERLNEPEVIAHLEAASIEPARIEAELIAVAPNIRYITPDDPRDVPEDSINLDLFPRDEYYLNNGG